MSRHDFSWERATKLFVVLWACLAVAAQAWLLRGSWPALPALVFLVLAGAAALALFDRRTVALVLVFAYVFPALIWLGHGQRHITFGILWMSGLLGAMLPDALRTPWHVPARWRAPLALWALVVAISVPILILRELDFYPGLFYVSGAPPLISMWVLHVALTLVLGILWFDWLFGARSLDFDAAVVTPLAASVAIMAGVAVWQVFVDFSFLNPGLFGAMGRAPGTMFDANVSGAVAALWTGGFLLWGQRPGHARPLLVAAGLAVAWLAVWASSSRTAFAAATLVTAVALLSLVVGRRRGTIKVRPRYWAAIAVAAVGLGLLLRFAGSNEEVVGPLARLWDTLPGMSLASWQAFATGMWYRDGYGPAADALVREFPLFGVGVSFFHVLGSYAGPIWALAPDNAQNWYRHQLAEFGLIGSLGWISWVIVFGYFVLRRHPGAPPAAWTARGMLIAFAAISLVGMPGQDVAVAITFWTIAFWYVSLVGIPPQAPALSRRSWALIAVVALVYAAGTAHLAATRLRPPVRAQHFGIPYAYGLYAPEGDGRGGEFHWTRQRAAIIVDAPLPWLELTVGVNHFDIAEQPVDVKVWVDGRSTSVRVRPLCAGRRPRRRSTGPGSAPPSSSRAAALVGADRWRQPLRHRRAAGGREGLGGRQSRAGHDAQQRRVRHASRAGRAARAAGTDRDAGQSRREAARFRGGG
jgi:hypothetical protein